MILAQLTATTFSMPPEPEPWKHSIAMGLLVLAGIVAVGKMVLDCARPTPNSAATSFGLAVASLVVTIAVTTSLRLNAPIESESADSRGLMAIVVGVLWMTNLGVAVFSSATLDPGKRIGIAFFGLLLAGLFLITWTPRLAGARNAARRTQCKNNAKSIGGGLLKMAKENGELPAPVLFNQDIPRSWRVELLPWLDQKAMRDRYQDARPWDDSDSNALVARTVCGAYQCPSSPQNRDERGFALTDYAAVIGPQTVWTEKNRKTFPQVVDGANTTLLLVEAAGLKIPWAEPRDADMQQLKTGVNLKGAAHGESTGIASGHHLGGCYGVFADGSVRFLSKNIDPKILGKLLTADGGEPTDGDEF
jgi:hypothetical protein